MERESRKNYQTRGSARGGGGGGAGGGTAAERDLLLQWETGSACAASRCSAATSRPRPRRPPRRPRNPEESGAMRPPSQQPQNNTLRTVTSPVRERSAKGNNDNNAVPPTSLDDKKGSSSGSEGSIWPNFAVSLTNKEKEEDFLVFKGSKLPQRPKKRVKAIQRTVNSVTDSAVLTEDLSVHLLQFVCPGTWLCDLTLERYEVREKKVSKKRALAISCPQGPWPHVDTI
uniref:Uncharacterized protein n=1 Tax=Aegilops tauschii TaxID=37682 RepID=R7WDT1_AEGTA